MKRTIAAVGAAMVLLGAFAGSATARTGLRLSPTNNTLTFASLEIFGGFGTVRCPVTQTITLHASVGKSMGTLAGQSRLTFGTCINGRAGLLDGVRRVTSAGPYHVWFYGWTGTLPSITSLIIENSGISFWFIEPTFSIECTTDGPQDLRATTTGGNPMTGMNIASSSVSLIGDNWCGFTAGSVSATGRLATATTITLI